MIQTLLAFLALLIAMPATAQQQQAGTATDTEAAFQALVDACDDVDALMLRARIRLQLPRTTEVAAAAAEEMLREGFQTCADGDPEAGKARLTEALEIAEAGTSEVFAAGEDEAAAETQETAVEETAAEETPDRPWWKFW
tara:strand:- start:351 stop:770 length:420 start_codon:yes stop_codon:yes gene_type:complete